MSSSTSYAKLAPHRTLPLLHASVMNFVLETGDRLDQSYLYKFLWVHS